MKPYLLQFSVLLMFIIVMQGCHKNLKPGYWANDKIDTDIRKELHKLNDQVFNDFKVDDIKHIRGFLSKEMLNSSSLYKQVELMGNHLTTEKYSLFKEYYVVNKWRSMDTIPNQGDGINKFSLRYEGLQKEMYIAFYLPESGDNKKMITTIYCNYDYGWRLAKLDLESYTVNGKTAPELYKLAQEKADKNYLSDAITNMELSDDCIHPNSFWYYPDDSLMLSFYNKLVSEANQKFTFPLPIKQVAGSPSIIRVSNLKANDGYYPSIYYLTSINLKDTAAVKKENANIRKVIGQVIPGIDKEKKYLFYSAFNERPTSQKSVSHFDMTDKLQ